MNTFYEQIIQSTENERQYLLSSPVLVDCLQGNVCLDQYTAFLKEAYHHVKHTVPLLMTCGGRLSSNYEWLRTAIAEYIEEEIGHQEWILNDIEACGLDKEKVRSSTAGINTEIMVSYAYDIVHRRNPVGFFGMVYVLEGTSVALATQAAEIIQSKLQLPNQAFSYLTSHGSLDIKHIDFYKHLVCKLDQEEDKKAIIHCAKVIYKLYADVFRALPAFNQQQVA